MTTSVAPAPATTTTRRSKWGAFAMSAEGSVLIECTRPWLIDAILKRAFDNRKRALEAYERERGDLLPVGTRVRPAASLFTVRAGQPGTIIKVYGTQFPYTVAFDAFRPDGERVVKLGYAGWELNVIQNETRVRVIKSNDFYHDVWLNATGTVIDTFEDGLSNAFLVRLDCDPYIEVWFMDEELEEVRE